MSRSHRNTRAVSLDRGAFVFSLDFELAWGTRGRPKAQAARKFFPGTRAAIRGLLQLLERHRIPATWAIVGGLLLESENDVRHPWLAASEFSDIPGGDSRSEPHWYAEDVFQQLLACSTPQEIGCHSLTHLYVDPSDAGREPFRTELERFLDLFEQRGVPRPQSFIYPKGIMGHEALLAEAGFRCYRGPESGWFESLPGELIPAGLRLVDARLGMAPHVGDPELSEHGLWIIPSSQFYSPFMSVGNYVSVKARVRKAVEGLRRAARRRKVYHLWTHPFNLGLRTDELLSGLDEILGEARRLSDAGQLDLLPMGDLAARLDDRHGSLLAPQQSGATRRNLEHANESAALQSRAAEASR